MEDMREYGAQTLGKPAVSMQRDISVSRKRPSKANSTVDMAVRCSQCDWFIRSLSLSIFRFGRERKRGERGVGMQLERDGKERERGVERERGGERETGGGGGGGADRQTVRQTDRVLIVDIVARCCPCEWFSVHLCPL